MMTIWERRIRHIDRGVKPTAVARLGLRGRLLKAKTKKLRGLPSRNLPIELVLERLSIKFEDQKTSGPDVVGRADRLRPRLSGRPAGRPDSRIPSSISRSARNAPQCSRMETQIRVLAIT